MLIPTFNQGETSLTPSSSPSPSIDGQAAPLSRPRISPPFSSLLHPSASNHLLVSLAAVALQDFVLDQTPSWQLQFPR
ncbi:hypothetical protein NL676_029558 [Syzygium grande]|nr:hypothetical protein NL676_029558 [Syzygium grande]